MLRHPHTKKKKKKEKERERERENETFLEMFSVGKMTVEMM